MIIRRNLRSAAWAGVLAACTLPVAGVLAAVPGEVTNLNFAQDKQTLNWDAAATAEDYTVYRGYLMDLAADYHGVTLEGDIGETNYADVTDPTFPRGFFYLVTASNGDGEGTMGSDSSAERVNGFPWPGRAVAGQWEVPRSWPLVPIHTSLLHTGEVLTYAGGGVPTTSYVWNPETDQFSSASVDSNIFCSAHSFLPDGRVFATGGTVPLFNGRKTTWIFDPLAGSWSAGHWMQRGRYYPSNVTTADGTVLIFSGNNENGEINNLVERYRPDTGMERLSGPRHTMTIYPAMHLLTDGRVLHTGPEGATEIFDPLDGSWSPVANTNFGSRGGGSGDFNSVMLPPGFQKFMILGGIAPGSNRSTNTAEIIDLSEPIPTWRYIDSMHFPRRHPNSLILPDGKVLVAGGGYDASTPSHPAEIFDPQTEQWTLIGNMKGNFRLYHSTTVLLPDGRAMWLGGTNPYSNPTAETYNPPYLFRGPRPAITSAPTQVGYGQSFQIGTPDFGRITSVVLIRPSSTTHSRNMSQRYVPLSFTATGDPIDATAPSDGNVAPPGYYLLWIVDVGGVPSEARFIHLQ